MISPGGNPMVSFNSNFTVKFARCADVGCSTSTTTTIAEAILPNLQEPTSLIAGSDGYPLIVFARPGTKLGIVHCTSADCATRVVSTPDDQGLIGQVGRHPTLTIGPDGLGIIGHSLLNPNTGAQMRITHCTNADCSSASSANLAGIGYDDECNGFTIGIDGLPLAAFRANALRVVHGSQDWSASQWST